MATIAERARETIDQEQETQQREEVERWQDYVKLLQREIEGKTTKTDIGRLAELMTAIGLNQRDVEQDLARLRQAAKLEGELAKADAIHKQAQQAAKNFEEETLGWEKRLKELSTDRDRGAMRVRRLTVAERDLEILQRANPHLFGGVPVQQPAKQTVRPSNDPSRFVGYSIQRYDAPADEFRVGYESEAPDTQ